jgi:prevent-host-death family protein
MEKKTWQLQEAKGRFCAVAEKAADGSPQLVTKHGRPFVYIVSAKSWPKPQRRPKTLLEILRSCPEDLTKLDLTRSRELPREIEL